MEFTIELALEYISLYKSCLLRKDKLLIIDFLIKKILGHQEKYEEATKSYFDAIKKGGEISEKESIRGYASLGYVFKKLGNTKRSRDYCEKAYNLGKKYADTSVMVSALNLLGLADKNEGNNDTALERFSEGLKLSKESKNLERESQILSNITNAYLNKKKKNK
mgnify:CR=1 FL=1